MSVSRTNLPVSQSPGRRVAAPAAEPPPTPEEPLEEEEKDDPRHILLMVGAKFKNFIEI